MNIVVTGCTGAGKTTVGRLLAGCLDARFIEEPFDVNPYLQASYEDPARFGVLSQVSFIVAFASAQKSWEDTQSDVVQERCMDDCVHVFIETLRLNGHADERGVMLANTVHTTMQNLLGTHPDAFVLVEASPEAIAKRIRTRGRAFEANLDTDFVRLQTRLYDAWLTTAGARVLRFCNDGVDLAELRPGVEELAHRLRLLLTAESGR